ncbi:alpha/beta hydrolase [Nocardia sp. NPDC003693]
MGSEFMDAPQAFARTDFDGVSRQGRMVHAFVRGSVKPVISAWSRGPQRRWPYPAVDQLGRVLPPVRGVKREIRSLPHCSAMLTTPARRVGGRFVVYAHGGAFLVGGRQLHRHMVGRLATLLGAQMLSVQYRKLPRHTIADAVSDCVDAYRYALDSGADPAEIVVMGDSAGGYLTMMTAIEIGRRGLPAPAALVAMAPLADWDFTAKLAAPSASTCAVFAPAMVPIFGEFVRAAVRDTALESPAHCDLTGLPPTLIQASRDEMVYPDAVLLAERLSAHGVHTELQTWPGQVHVFQAASGFVPEATRALGEIADFVDRTLARPRLSRSA